MGLNKDASGDWRVFLLLDSLSLIFIELSNDFFAVGNSDAVRSELRI